MTKLGHLERESFKDIFKEDMAAINQKVYEQIDIFWEQARRHLIKKFGHDKLIEEKQQLKRQIAEIQEKIHGIEEKLNGEPLTVKQVRELGGRINKEGRAVGAEFYGKEVTSHFEYEMVKLIKKNINLEIPAKFLHDLGRAALREITMSGSFETAQKIYQKFYALDFRKYGVDIPPRLSEIKKSIPLLEESINLKKISHQKKKIKKKKVKKEND